MKQFFLLIFFLTSFQVTQSASNAKIPFVYHPGYNISVLGLEKFHKFDTHKYAHIVERLKEHFHWTDDQFHSPRQATDEELKEFHAPEYINSLNQSWKELFIRAAGFGLLLAGLSQFANLGNHRIKLIIAGIYALWGLRPFQARAYSQGLGDSDKLTIPFMLLPGPLLRYCLLAPMKYAVNGTALALKKALAPEAPGYCVNLSGGYHHARAAGGGGFCFLNDTAVALLEEIKKNADFKALIIDLDFHCGDGNADFASKYPDNVTIIDIYGSNHYPDIKREESITYANPIVAKTSLFWNENHPNKVVKGEKNSHWYCDLVRKNLEKVRTQHFDCVIFNAGTDVYEGDELGSFMGLTKEQIIERDAIVFEFAKEQKIPLVQVLSGGYNKQMGAEIVADCLINSYKIMQKN